MRSIEFHCKYTRQMSDKDSISNAKHFYICQRSLMVIVLILQYITHHKSFTLPTSSSSSLKF